MENPDHIFSQINSKVSTTRSQVIIAKEFILKAARERNVISTKECLQEFLVAVDCVLPKQVVIHQSVDSSQTIQQIVSSISWQLAFSEAIWSVVHSNLLLFLDMAIIQEEPHVSWTTVVPGSGGHSSGWRFSDWRYSLPERLRIAPSMHKELEFLVDPDLYLQNLQIDNLHPDVSDALGDAVRCFRAELYTPCLAMLAKAMEGAWTELGLALVKSVAVEQSNKIRKQADTITSEFSSIAKKIKTVLELYEKQDIFGDLSQKSGVKLDDLRQAITWADCVRESRNVVHYGNKASLPNNFEKVATLLLGAPAHFKLVYRLMNAAKGKM